MRVICLVIGSCLWFPAKAEEMEFLGEAIVPGTMTDLSGFESLHENGTPQNQFGGISALDYSGAEDIYFALADRGPDDGAVAYKCRFHRVRIVVQPGAPEPVKVEILSTTPLTDESGRVFVGSSRAIEPAAGHAGRLDPEGIRRTDDGSLFISDEYGPSVLQFDLSGRLQRRLSLPGHLHVAQPSADAVLEIAENQVGRVTNRGLECLAVSTDGNSLVALMQGPLLQDGERNRSGKVVGLHCRLLKVDLGSGAVREFVYSLADRAHGNSEIIAVGPDEYLVLERDGEPGAAAGFRKVVRVSLSGATEVTGMVKLPTDVPTVNRVDLLDLLDPRWKLAGDSMPEKLESLAFGPDLADGRKLLLIVSDNDFESESPTRIWAFALPQRIAPAL